jgi:hypothetical protein
VNVSVTKFCHNDGEGRTWQFLATAENFEIADWLVLEHVKIEGLGFRDPDAANQTAEKDGTLTFPMQFDGDFMGTIPGGEDAFQFLEADIRMRFQMSHPDAKAPGSIMDDLRIVALVNVDVQYETDDFEFELQGVLKYEKFDSESPPHDSPHRLMIEATMSLKKADLFTLNNLYTLVTFNMGESKDETVPLAEIAISLELLQVSSVTVSGVNITVTIFKREQKAGETAARSTKSMPSHSPPPPVTQTVYSFEFELTGEVTVGEFEVMLWATYANGVFESNITLSVDTTTVMGVTFAIEGEGSIKLPCEEFGDVSVGATVTLVSVTPDLEGTLGGVVGLAIEGSLVGDGASTWELELEVILPQGSALDIGPVSLPLPEAIKFGYAKNPETSTLSFGFEFDMFTVAFSTDSASGMKMAQLTVNEGVTLRKLFSATMDIFKHDKEGGEAQQPMDGLDGATSSASLGGKSKDMGGLFTEFLDAELPDIEITLAKATTATSAHIRVAFELFGVEFSLSVLFVKRTGGKKWSTVFYAGVELPNGKFIFDSPWTWVADILNVILLVAGSPDKFGFIYTKEKMRLVVGKDVPEDVLPYKPNNLRKGLSMYTESNLNEKPPSGLTGVIVETLEALAGGKDTSDDLPDRCNDKANEADEECKVSPVQKVFKDCSEKEEMVGGL